MPAVGGGEHLNGVETREPCESRSLELRLSGKFYPDEVDISFEDNSPSDCISAKVR
jgi:hypothetical protein